ncbi:replication initiation protein [Escherichia coli]|nr:replication initiation protein [Escherichia coli]
MSDLIAYKSNALVEASYKLTLQEQRFLLLCIGRLKSGSDAESTELQKTMTVTAEEYFDSFPDMGRKNAEVQLQEAIDRLWDRSIILRTMRSARSSAGSSIGHSTPKGEGKAQITFSDAVMPYLTQLKGQFTRVVIKNISNLSRSYSIRIYELLQQFRSTGERIIALDDFRSMLDIEHKYQTYKSLNQQLLRPCVDELNQKSDLAVTLETIKKGRTVVALHFRFKEDKQIKMTI